MDIRDVNKGIPYYHEEDNMKGLKEAVNTRRTFLALDYLLQIVTEQEERIKALESPKPKAAPAKKAAAKDDSTDA